MNLLILSCNTGEGHNSAAAAIKEYAESVGSMCDIKDALSFWSEEKSNLISKGHSFVYRKLPKLFGVGYRFEEKHPPKGSDASLIYDIVTRGSEGLLCELKNSRYDAVICTHVFSALMLTKIRKEGYSIPTFFVATDYTCSPGVGETDIDGCFIPHRELAEEFVEKGVSADRIVVSGIPVKGEFYKSFGKSDAKSRLGLPKGEKTVLLMCGSMGCGPIKELAEKLPQNLPENTRLVIICGKNDRLFKLLSRGRINEKVTLVSYTKQMPLYMDAADLIVTKAGGLSSTEAAVKGLPLIFIDAVPGCETRNIEFFSARGLADFADDCDGIISLVCDMMNNPKKISDISVHLKSEFGENASEIIYNYVKEVVMCKGKN